MVHQDISWQEIGQYKPNGTVYLMGLRSLPKTVHFVQLGKDDAPADVLRHLSVEHPGIADSYVMERPNYFEGGSTIKAVTQRPGAPMQKTLYDALDITEAVPQEVVHAVRIQGLILYHSMGDMIKKRIREDSPNTKLVDLESRV